MAAVFPRAAYSSIANTGPTTNTNTSGGKRLPDTEDYRLGFASTTGLPPSKPIWLEDVLLMLSPELKMGTGYAACATPKQTRKTLSRHGGVVIGLILVHKQVVSLRFTYRCATVQRAGCNTGDVGTNNLCRCSGCLAMLYQFEKDGRYGKCTVLNLNHIFLNSASVNPSTFRTRTIHRLLLVGRPFPCDKVRSACQYIEKDRLVIPLLFFTQRTTLQNQRPQSRRDSILIQHQRPRKVLVS